MGEEQLSMFLKPCCPSQDEHSSGDRGSGRIWHGQTLEKAVDIEVPGDDSRCPHTQLGLLQPSAMLEVLTEQHEEMRERRSRP